MSDIAVETVSQSTNPCSDLVMLHGWAMHSGVMFELAETLSSHFRVHLVDLPGHGLSKLTGSDYDPVAIGQNIHDCIKQKIDNKAIWLGWSLGGLVALSIASQFPRSVSKLILLSSNPAFVKREDWSYAMDENVFEEFSGQLLDDAQATIKRFLALQVHGCADSREQLKKLNHFMVSRPMAQQQALVGGMKILQQQDLREVFRVITQPVLLVSGERDKLVPVTAMQALRNMKTNTRTYTVSKAGHAPFISHLQETADVIRDFCRD